MADVTLLSMRRFFIAVLPYYTNHDAPNLQLGAI
jgi:hypothetical protein